MTDPTHPAQPLGSESASSPSSGPARAAAVIVAAGNSTRMQLRPGVRKPFLVIQGRTVLEHTVAAFDACPEIAEILIVAQDEDIDPIERLAHGNPTFKKLVSIVPGGAERTDSVRAGVQASSAACEFVAIHDGARLLIKTSTIQAACECARERGAALVAIPVQDTLKHSRDGKHAESTLDRSVLWAAQTPQVFRRAQILELFDRGQSAEQAPTDDAALYEQWVGPIPIVRGDSSNLKLTTPTDLEIVRALLSLRESPNSGH